MKTSNLLIAITLIASLLVSCKKNEVKPSGLFTGRYTGTFTYSNTDPAVNYVPLSGRIAVAFANKRYSATSPFSMFAASASGNFTYDNKQVTFADTTIHTANFDWSLILNGPYTYSTKGDSLFLVKKVAFSTYTYKLFIDRTVLVQ